MENYNLKKFEKYLLDIKCYSIKTYETYIFYVKKLNNLNNNYLKLLSLLNKKSVNTKRIMLSAIKTYYKFINDKRYQEIFLPKKEKKIKDYITYDEYKEITNYLESKKNKQASKKLIIVKLLFETGIRSSELLNIKIKNIEENKIKILGKNKKERFIYISENLKEKIQNFIKNNKLEINLFDFKYKNLYKTINSFKNIINKNISPHMFRRGFATYCMDQNIGIYEISLMLGHENINTTTLYLRSENKIKIMQTIFEQK